MSDTAWVSVSVAGSCEAKLQLLFMMYDRNHSGSLSRDEVSEIIRFVRSRSHIFGLKYQSRLLQTNPRDAMRHTRHTLSKLVSTGSIFTIFLSPNGMYLREFSSFSDSSRDVAMATNFIAKFVAKLPTPCTYVSVIPKRNGISLPQCACMNRVSK